MPLHLKDACLPQASQISTHLVAIDSTNKGLIVKVIRGEKYVLMVAWKQDISFYVNDTESGFYDTKQYPIWVTTAPELINRFRTYSHADTSMRLKQLLGLPPHAVYNYFVEFWVRPQDMFRPCPDKEITDHQCSLCFPAGTDSTHIKWINHNRLSRYYNCNLEDNYPWTQLGYTYDWSPSNKSHFGLSEFVISANSKIVVNKTYTTSGYLKK